LTYLTLINHNAAFALTLKVLLLAKACSHSVVEGEGKKTWLLFEDRATPGGRKHLTKEFQTVDLSKVMWYPMCCLIWDACRLENGQLMCCQFQEQLLAGVVITLLQWSEKIAKLCNRNGLWQKAFLWRLEKPGINTDSNEAFFEVLEDPQTEMLPSEHVGCIQGWWRESVKLRFPWFLKRCSLWLTGEDELISPCLCRGTQKFVHRSCLDNWRAVKVTFAPYSCVRSPTTQRFRV
jgi:hypothetical protein